MQDNNIRNKRILFAINSLSFGGAEKLVVDQANYLSSHGFDVSVLTLKKDKLGNFRGRLAIPKEKVFFMDSDFNILSVFKLYKFLRNQNFDFVVSNLFLSNTLIRVASFLLLRRPKIIIYEHNAYGREKKGKHLFVDWLLSFITLKIIAVSVEVEEYLVKNRISKDKIKVIKNGIEFPKVDYGAARLKRQSLGVEDSDILVVAVGNVSYQKGHDVLLDAASIVNSGGARRHLFLVCGDDRDKILANSLREKIVKYGLADNFKLLGSREDVADIVSAADIFAMPSRWEGLSIALLEAMSLKKPVLVSDVKSMREVISDGISGLTFAGENSKDLAQKITLLVNDDSLRVRLGESAFEVAQKYSIESNINELLRLLGDSHTDRANDFNLGAQKSKKWLRRTEEAVKLIRHIDLSGKEDLNVADFGCGDKKVFELLKGVGGIKFKYTGFDLLPQSDDVVKTDFSREFPDGSFDLAFCLGLIEYLEHPDFFFGNLKKGCRYVILSCVISDANRYTKEEVIKSGWKNYPSSVDLIKLIHDNDFEILESKIIDEGVTFLTIIKNNKFN